ncbi:MAG: hypothetical protein QNJ00_16645 [Woeseiaceae bacterium]|nr:hypothetical protein [Woeseiaceae bacterium]
MRALPLLILLIAATAAAAESTAFHYPPIGWHFEIPSGWVRTTDEEIEAVRDRGSEVVTDVLGEPVDVSTLTPVLYLESPPQNSFTADVEGWDPAVDGDYAENQQDVFDVVLASIDHIEVEYQHSYSNVAIDGIDFRVLEIEIMHPTTGEPFLKSRMFDALLGEQSLAVSYSCTNAERCEEIHAAIVNSRFDR